MADEAAGPTPPEPARPLDARERDALAEIEASTRQEDPEWSALLAGESTFRPSSRRTAARIRNLAIQVAVVAVLAVVLMPSAWVGGLLVAVVMIGPVGAALWAMRRGVL
ncbi:hypothetical protein Acsp06_44660 [Actinomycetospora sp. NBRC 106375]|uniref:DUF3040 domain-containing protein n=1 Tax=Actinomycetospora sp. NBRC 106375 TaxID=3032207 RepID=UPI0024A2C266|nr:DUF3040 domain-containing protein [Actinomycetospora sp. NBRC 106375]GLZ48281.1 hypothetical protein Acsp06_44660 [Actinomycetospora sp. NBRC 106375]